MRHSHALARSVSVSLEPLERRRLLAAGALDPSFSSDGKATVNLFNAFDIAQDVAVQADGKTVVVGRGRSGGGDAVFSIARFNLDGTLDQTFGPEGGGAFTLDLPGLYGARGVAIQQDGKIVIVGDEYRNSEDYYMTVVRLNPGGTLDSTFDGDGIKYVDFGSDIIGIQRSSHGYAVVIDGDGKIVVGGEVLTAGDFGEFDWDFALARLNDNGSLDSSFEEDGKTIIGMGADDEITGLALDGDLIVAVGTKENDDSSGARMVVARFTPDGDLDLTFDDDGSGIVTFPGNVPTRGSSVLVQPGVGYVAVGRSGGNVVMTRFLRTGPLDGSFGTSGNGWVSTDFGGGEGGDDVIRSAEGGLIALGTSDGRLALAGYNANGVPNSSFGTNGKVLLTDTSNMGFPRMASGPGRRFVVAGGPSFFTARFLDAGANLVSIGSFDSEAAEAGRDPASVIIARTERLPTPLRVYLSVSGTAKRPGTLELGPRDFTGTNISFGNDQTSTTYVDILANETFTVVTITPNEDTTTEGDETAVFALRPNENYDLATPSSMTVVIHDNDGFALYPLADAHVRDGIYANTNYGTATFMETKRTTSTDRTRESYIKFNTATLNVPIQNVRLRVFGRLESAAPAVPTSVYGVSNSSWTENGITWNNRPAPSTGALSSVNVGTTGESFYDFDVTSFIRSERNAGRNLISLILRNTADSSPVTYWGSRTWNNPPQLIVNGVVAIPGGAPQVVQVFVDSTAWSAPFRQHLEDTGLGDSVWGLSVTDSAGQLTSLPWANANRIRIRFSLDTQVAADDLVVRGVNVPLYAQATLPDGTSGFSYDAANRVATWTFQPFGLDKLMLDLDADAGGVTASEGIPLDGEWDNSGVDTYPSGNGTSGGDFRFRLNSLPADADGNGTVTVGDLGILATNFGQSMRGPRQGDFSGDGVVTVGDLGILSTYFGRSLPSGSPALTSPSTKSSTSTTSSFSTASFIRGDRGLRRMRIAEDILAAGRLDD